MIWSNISAKEGAQFYYFNDWIFEENYLGKNKKNSCKSTKILTKLWKCGPIGTVRACGMWLKKSE